MIKRIFIYACLLYPGTSLAMPEFPFCPFGGPPGWYNRLVGDHGGYRYRPPPPYLLPPPVYLPPPVISPPAGPATHQRQQEKP